jgi:predicted nuclease with TOPRIM domain
MTEQTENLVLEILRAIRGELAAVKEDVREVKNRLANLEVGQGTILQHMGHLASSQAQLQISFDRLSTRVERIETRLSVAGAS